MEFIIGVGIVAIIALIVDRRKRYDSQRRCSSLIEDHKRLQQLDEELITVVLPTINKD